jgi:hypothetical protein
MASPSPRYQSDENSTSLVVRLRRNGSAASPRDVFKPSGVMTNVDVFSAHLTRSERAHCAENQTPLCRLRATRE